MACTDAALPSLVYLCRAESFERCWLLLLSTGKCPTWPLDTCAIAHAALDECCGRTKDPADVLLHLCVVVLP